MIGLSARALDPTRSDALPLASLTGIVSILLDPRAGAETTAAIPDADLGVVLADLANAVAELADGERARASVRASVGPKAWEIGVERDGHDVLVSVFRPGTLPEVVLRERRTRGEALAQNLAVSLEALLARRDAPFAERTVAALRRLGRRRRFDDGPPSGATQSLVAVEPTGGVPFEISAELAMRLPPQAIATPTSSLRTEILPLLFRGRLRVVAGERQRDLSDVCVFFVTEQLVRLALEALDAAITGSPLTRKVEVGGAICGVRLGVGARQVASVTIGVVSKTRERADTATFPDVDVASYAQGVLAFGRALVRSLVRRDRSQSQNLRVIALREQLRELSVQLRDAGRTDAKINGDPDSYRAFAAAVEKKAPLAAFGRGRLRFSQRWSAAVPGVDLRATFLCGRALVVGSSREIACVDAQTGELAWRRAVGRAVSVMTPAGLARLDPAGVLELHDLSTGDVCWSVKLTPRVGNASGAVISCPGLPRMLIVSEGRRHLTAVDLDAGEVRWRYAAKRAGTFRVRRAGRLAIVACGEHALTALDILSGEVVWRHTAPLRFASQAAADHDALFALAGDGAFLGRGGARLYHLDPWSGCERWSVELPACAIPVGSPLIAQNTVALSTYGRRGTGLIGFDRESGAKRFDCTVTSGAASCLVIDDTIIVNSESGELSALEADDGRTRYRQVLCSPQDGGDRPRRLEPILRSGALFVPQQSVVVVCPRDGAILGTVPTDLVPDLLRVDDRCDVFVVEESGHVAAFGAAARLSLVGSS